MLLILPMSRLVLILLDRPSRLTQAQLDKLADVFVNMGTLFFGAMVVPHIVPGIDKPVFRTLILGLVISLVFWIVAISSVRRIRL